MCVGQRLAACRAAARAAPSRRAGARAGRAGRCGASPGRGRCAAGSAADRAAAAAAAGAGTARRSARAAPCPSPSARGGARPGRGSARSGVSYCTPDGHAVTQAMQPRQASQCDDHRVASSARPRGPPSSGRSGRAGSPSPRPTARRSGRSAGRTRSARSRRSGRRPAGGARRRRRRARASRGRRCCPSPRAVRASVLVLGRVGHLDASHESARREPVVGVELVLDPAHQVERRDRSPHVDGRLDRGGRVHHDGAAAVPGAGLRGAGRRRRAPRRPVCRRRARRTPRRRRPSRARAAPASRAAASTSAQPGEREGQLERGGAVVTVAVDVPGVRRTARRRRPADSVAVSPSSVRTVAGPAVDAVLATLEQHVHGSLRRRPATRPRSPPGTAWECSTDWTSCVGLLPGRRPGRSPSGAPRAPGAAGRPPR